MNPGDRIAGRFEIEARAGAGGMGTVYRAVDRVTRSPVAVKVLDDADPDARARFRREGAVLGSLAHPAIVEYVAHGVAGDDQLYLVMAWVEGESLAARLAGGALPAAEAVATATRIAGALAEAHRHGVIHRDVKPANILYAAAGAVLVDFGIARAVQQEPRLTGSGTTVGTFGYMAPEQLFGSRAALGPQVDVFALGCVLHECLTGQAPFAGDDVAARAKLILCEPPRVAHLSGPLDALLARMLAREPASRPADGAQVAGELGAIGPLAERGPPPRRAPAAVPPLTGDQDVVCVLLLSGEADGARSIGGGLSAIVVEGRGDAAPARAVRSAQALGARPSAVATGQAIEDTIDRAVRLLAGAVVDATLPGRGGGDIWLDAATAGLLPASFRVAATPAGHRFLGESP